MPEDNDWLPEKIHHVIYYILLNLGRQPGATELDNILYLIDFKFAEIIGRSMTGAKYIRSDWGPYSQEIRDAIKEMKWREVNVITERIGKSERQKYTHRAGDYPRFEPKLDGKEITIIQNVIESVNDKSPIGIKRMVYHTRPMEEIRKMEENEKLIGEELELIEG